MTLPTGVEPLILADGTKINPIDGGVVSTDEDEYVEVPNYEDTQRELVIARQRLTDLPVPPQQMNLISIVIGYTLMGVTDEDIASVLQISESQIERIKQSDVFAEIKNKMVENITQSDVDHVRGMFTQASVIAAQKITSLINHKSPGVSMAAAKDILDRAGQRPVDVVHHKHSMEGGLVIKHVKRYEEEEHPTITLDADGEF